MTKRDHLIVRKDGVLCTRCLKIEPVHPGDGTPMATYLVGLEMMAERHQKCKARTPAAKEVGHE